MVSQVKEFRHEKVVCITVIDKKDALLGLLDRLGKYKNHIYLHLQENFYSPTWYWLTIHSSLATKDKAIETLLKIFQWHKDNLVVFGDNINDLKMFKYAKKAIAVGNATKELKQIADHLIGTNEQNSVVTYILKENGLM